MVDKECYRFLKHLYNNGTMTDQEAWDFFGHKDGDKRLCKQLSFLRSLNMIETHDSCIEEDGEGGMKRYIRNYQITITGRAFIEQKQRDVRNFWVPYLITTLIAVSSLAVSIYNATLA